MSHSPPIPQGNQSPYPIQEPPHPATASDTVGEAMTKATETIAPLADKAKAFAKARPYATAALVGTVALALFNTLRGKRVG